LTPEQFAQLLQGINQKRVLKDGKGRRLWAYRTPAGGWFAHGWFA
jgi:hypothetical protein